MIPIAKPQLGDEEKKAVAEVCGTAQLTNGPRTREFENAFAKYVGTKHAIATNSGTSALHTVLLAADIGIGNKVITTPFSFVASANAILYCGADPVFVDIDSRTYNINPAEIEKNITDSTKAIMPVHLYGLACDMGPIMDIGEDHNLLVIEDACQAHGAEYKKKRAGSLGDAACFSFYPTKNMTTGEGGMITTDDSQIADMCRIIINQGQKVRYYNDWLGYNYRMTEFSAAIGVEQLKKLDQFNKKRKENAAFYDEKLEGKFELPFVPKGYKHVYHQYTIRTNRRDEIISKFEKAGIGYGIYYPLLISQQKIYSDSHHGTYEVAERATKEVLSIPVHPALSNEELEKIIQTLL